MREIKFRAWDKTLKGWIAEDFFITQNGKVFLLRRKVAVGYDTDDVELMQYTGLKDKNGKEIYEGDIVEYISGNQRVLGEVLEIGEYGINIFNSEIKEEYVRADKKIESIKLREEHSKGPLKDDDDDELGCNETIIVGNIYENPELLN